MSKLGKQLKIARKHSGFTTRQVEKALKLGSGVVSRHEKGTEMRFKEGVRYARLYGVDVATFAAVVK